MNAILMIIAAFVATYVVAAIPFALIVSRSQGVDLRKIGSGNIGATNVYRSMGFKWAVIVFLLDAIKGFIPTIVIINVYNHMPILHVLIAAMAIFAHSYTVFANFKGGKGAATGLGVLLALSPIIFIGIAVLAIVIILKTRYVSVGTMTCCVLIPISFFLLSYPWVYTFFVSFICLFVIYRHKPNIKRLIAGKENKI